MPDNKQTESVRAELFIVEREDGEWIDSYDSGGYSVFLSLSEAQDALDSEADNCEDERTAYRIVRFLRVEVING